jgi:Ran-binding protein 1
MAGEEPKIATPTAPEGDETKVRPNCTPSSPNRPLTRPPIPNAQSASPTPIFGAASTFGAGTGFGGFTGVVAKTEDGGEGGDEEAAPEEECAAEFKPVVQLDEVEVSTGEEEEESLFDL